MMREFLAGPCRLTLCLLYTSFLTQLLTFFPPLPPLPPLSILSSLPAIWGSDGIHPVKHFEPEDHNSSEAVSAGGPFQAARWSPYNFNGGTALGISGDDFAVVASDTRLSEEYSILSRNVSKARKLTEKCVIATGGCWTDVATLHKVLHQKCEMYKSSHEREMNTPAIAQMLGNTLYGRRFFPYYAFNVVAGLDSEGKGAVYTYDAVGSFERVGYAAQGAGQKLIIPLLDNLVGGKNRKDKVPSLSAEAAVELCKDAFITAGERDIYTGDSVEIVLMTKNGMKREVFQLKKD
jgi:20S proteasome subunit beta 6